MIISGCYVQFSTDDLTLTDMIHQSMMDEEETLLFYLSVLIKTRISLHIDVNDVFRYALNLP
jgi:hypothetical protein